LPCRCRTRESDTWSVIPLLYNHDNFFTLTNRDSTLTDNAVSYGGGIDNAAGIVDIRDSTLTSNSAGVVAGGIYNGASRTLTVQDSTVLGNVAPLGGDLDNAGLLVVDDSTNGDRYDV
jgi:hypothetical protein